MATAAIESHPQPGDGAWLTRIHDTNRRRRRRRMPSNINTRSLAEAGSGPTSSDEGIDEQGKSKGTQATAPDTGNEPTSLHSGPTSAPQSEFGRTIAPASLLLQNHRKRDTSRAAGLSSPTSPPTTRTPLINTNTKHKRRRHKAGVTRKTRGTMEGVKAIPPHLRGKAIPPHLRNKQKQAMTTKDAVLSVPANTTSPAPVQSYKPIAPPFIPVTPPAPAASSSPTVTGLAASKHAPLTVRNASAPSSSPVKGVTQKPQSAAVVVSEPKPVSKPVLVTYASSEEDDEPAGKSNSASSKGTKKQTTAATSGPAAPPTSANAKATSPPASPEAQMRSRAGSSAHHCQRGASTSRGQPAMRARGCGGRAPREGRWPKNSEIPKGDPERWVTIWDDRKNISSVDSVRADSGWGEKNKKANVPAGIDPETGFQLTDYSGHWGPPPVDWDSRPAFSSHQCVETVDKWRQRIEVEMMGKSCIVPYADLVADTATTDKASCAAGIDSIVQGDVAPRCWAPIVVGQEAPQTFWTKLVKSDEPEPIDKEDLVDVKPWWDMYQTRDSCALRQYDHPKIEGVSPTETQRERLARENDNGSLHHAENRRKAEIAKKDADRERRKRAMEKARKLSAGQPTAPACEIKTGLKLYLRSACPDDIPKLKEIYNHYVEHTVCVPEIKRRKDADMLQRYNDILSKKLPFIVACEKGGQVKARKSKHDPVTLPDKIVGFAYADDHHDMKGMYRFTADIEVYVDSAQYMKGVGKCLCDKLLGLLDPNYIERGGYEIEGEELEAEGALRVISNIIATVSYDGEERLEWKTRFLNDFLGFERVGHMKETGNKLGQSVNVAIFQRSTGVHFNPANPPIMWEYTK